MEGSSAAAEPDQLESSGKDKENAEDYISRELLRLSLTDRNAIQEEMHGVRCFAPKESPEMIQKSLEAFWVSFSALPEEKKVTFKKCQLSAKSNPDHYAFQPSFLLRFLRYELFNVQKAAIRYANYLDFALKLYGEVVLQREFRFSDFNKDEIKGIRKGCVQLLPIRDQSGRRVIALVKRLFCLSGIDKRSKVSELTNTNGNENRNVIKYEIRYPNTRIKVTDFKLKYSPQQLLGIPGALRIF